jgi:hypothetical protein
VGICDQHCEVDLPNGSEIRKKRLCEAWIGAEDARACDSPCSIPLLSVNIV